MKRIRSTTPHNQRGSATKAKTACFSDLLPARSPARHGRAVAAAGVEFRFVQAPIALWDSDRLPAIDLPVANAMNEKRHERSMHRSRIQD